MAWQMSTTPVLSSWIITFHQTGIHSSLIQTGQTMLLMCFFIFYPRKESWMTPTKSSRLFHIYIHTLKKKYLKSFITGITNVSCQFSLSWKKDYKIASSWTKYVSQSRIIMLQRTNHLKNCSFKVLSCYFDVSLNWLLIIILLLIGQKKSDAGNSNASGTVSVRDSAQGSSWSYSKLSLRTFSRPD